MREWVRRRTIPLIFAQTIEWQQYRILPILARFQWTGCRLETFDARATKD
jgi:hypothetical protein